MAFFGLGSKDANQLGLVNTNVPIDLRSNIQIDQSKKEQKTITQTTTSDNRQYAPVDARQYSFIIDSQGASSSLASRIEGARSNPVTSPVASAPTDFGTTSAQPTLEASLFGGGVSNWLWAGLAVGGGVLLISALGGKK